MQGRELSTADASSRPQTSSHRPTTSGGYYSTSQGTGYTYSNDYSIEEEEESEDEDVFAYVPPTTADQQAGALPPILQSPASPPNDSAEPRHVTFPAPVFDPSNPPQDSGQSNPNALSNLLFLHQQALNPPPTGVVETPPSTDSQHAIDDPYRLRRIEPQTPLSIDGQSLSQYESTKVSSRRGDFSLTSGKEKMRDGEPNYGTSSGKSHSISGLESSPSVIDSESRTESIKMGFDFDTLGEEEDDSPFPEVRASVSNIDDPEMPAMTLRMWLIGLILCLIASALNVYYNFRSPAPSIAPLALVLIAYPIGKFFALVIPTETYRLPRWLGGLEFSLNPGPWNVKEHVLVYIMANVAVTAPYALNAIVVLEVYYGVAYGFGFDITLVLATQLTGFGLAGLCRRFLVWPASMVWPQNLVACTLLNTLHAEEDEESGGISRYRFFMYVFGGAFAFFFFPGFLFTALSVFSWICWITPRNVPVNQLFGVSTGLGMSVVTFDWSQISWIGSPLMIPWWAEVHVFAGFVLFYWIMVPILYYTNTWNLAHFPISDNVLYDKFGDEYNVTRVLTPQDTFDMEAYNNYSPLYLPATLAMTYLLAFTLSTCVLIHTLLYHGRTLINGFKRMKVEKDDIHAKLMRNYPEVPDWWYGVAFVTFFACAIVAMEVWKTGVPVWALLLAVLLPVVYVLPSGFIYAMTGQSITLNLIAQIIPGTLLPGNPLANMVFKAYSVQTLTEATFFVQDLKLGHYMKVPPRSTFTVQLVSTCLAAFVQVGVKQWMFANIHDICQKGQQSSLTCPHNQVFFTASAIWGLVGPKRQFGPGSVYYPFLYAIIIGAFLPFPFWLWQRWHPKSRVKYISTPIVLNGVGFIPPATGINYSSWFIVGFIFQYWIRRRNFLWWSKFNYVTSAALDSGTVFCFIFIFFTLQYPKGGVTLKWWGNEVWTNTADYDRTPLLQGPVPQV